MATPTVTASLNKAAFAPGELMTLTIDHADTDRQQLTITVSVTDSQGNTGTATPVTCVIDQGTISIVSSPLKTWTLQPGSTIGHAVYTATA